METQLEATEARTKGGKPQQEACIHNAYGQPLDVPLEGWTARHRPPRTPMEGRRCRLEPLRAERHADALFAQYAAAADGRDWTYLPYGPFERCEDYVAVVQAAQDADDPMFFAIIDHAQGPVGVAAFMRIAPEHGCMEVGHVSFSPALQRSPVATEAMYLMMRRAFDELGYRRYEWKCHALNARSRRAAERLGFQHEGIFRQAAVAKGRNRDTAWFSILDREWPAARARLEAWLEPDNFDGQGQQRRRLQDCNV